jgi:hypothetical protein
VNRVVGHLVDGKRVDTVSHVVLCFSVFRLCGNFPAAQRIVFTYAKERQITVYFGSVHRGAQLQWIIIQSILLIVRVLGKKVNRGSNLNGIITS